jgi:hypothetical protein
MGTGSNMVRTGLAHSSGVVFIGTYGPQPAIVWRYDPHSGELRRLGTPGEYQLDSMVEAPNGRVYIGTCYNGLVYELDPNTGAIRDLGSPPVESTPWIFALARTRTGEIFGAKGVGIFHLDWRTGEMTACGLVPGEHQTPGVNSSAPIIRAFEERPDGLFWGATNRWVFTFDPATREIVPVADLAAIDDACYAVIHAGGQSPVPDLYLQVYSRFSGLAPRHSFYVCRARDGEVEPIEIAGIRDPYLVLGWWTGGDAPRWLVAERDPATGVSTVALVDIETRVVADRWSVDGADTPPFRLAGPGLWFSSTARGTLFRADPAKRRLVAVAANPEPVECRCLAASPTGRLGTDTYDCGFVFTRDLRTGEVTDHGRVWLDDHRCNYGPAAFAGDDGRYFLANHGETWPRLWVTDLRTNRHWPVGEAATQLVRFSDGTIWGVEGPNPPAVAFLPGQCWTPEWRNRAGAVFRYQPGSEAVERFPEIIAQGPIAELPGIQPRLLCVDAPRSLGLQDEGSAVDLPGHWRFDGGWVVAMATDIRRGCVYLVLSDGWVKALRPRDGHHLPDTMIDELAPGFGPSDRGVFVLPDSGRLVGVAADGTVSVYDPETNAVSSISGPPPLPAGPAVGPAADAWYFAHRTVMRYVLEAD